MRKALAVGGLTAVLGAGIAGTAAAGTGSANDGPAQHGASAVAAIGGADALHSRVSAFVQQGGFVNRSKGVSAVSHPSTGLYCIRPSVAISTARIVPSVSVDWSTSLGDALMAQWRSSGIGCPVGQIAVLTLDGEDGSFDLSDRVSFTLNVP